MIPAVPEQNDICLTVKLDPHLWELATGGQTHFPPEGTEEAEPALGNGALLWATEDAGLFIPPHDWKENWMPFDVINLSITAFAHKMSV